MSTHIFTYGSLMFPEVWRKVTSGNYGSDTAHIKNLTRKKIKRDTYPVAFKAITDTPLTGILYFDVCNLDIEKLDRFEGNYYQRQTLRATDRFNDEYTVDIYLLRPRYQSLASNKLWSEEEFETKTIKRFMRTYMASRM